MKRLVITALITILTASEGISQTSTDTTCIPNSQLKKVINRLETCKVIEEELTVTKSQLQLSQDRISTKDSLISKFKLQIGNYETLVNNYQRTEGNYKAVVENQRKQIVLRDKIIRRKAFSKWVTAFAGIGLGILIAK